MSDMSEPDYKSMWEELAKTVEWSLKVVTDSTRDSEEREDAAIAPMLLARIQRSKYVNPEDRGTPIDELMEEFGMERTSNE